MAARRRRKTTYRKPAKTTRRRRASSKNNMQLDVEAHVLKDIWAVFYATLGVLTILSIRGNLGVVGRLWVAFLEPVFGWGVYAVPVVLIGMAIMSFLSRSIHVGITRWLGIVLLSGSALGLVHLSVPDADVLEVAKAGEYGGYVGFVASFILKSILGNIGSYVVLMASIVISILLIFDVSLTEIIAVFKSEQVSKGRRVTEKDESEEAEEDYFDDFDVSGINIVKPEQIQVEQKEAIRDDEIALREVKPEDMDIEVDLENADNKTQDTDTSYDDEDYEYSFPDLAWLDATVDNIALDQDVLRDGAEKIRNKLDQFGIKVAMHDVHVGPTVVQYSLKPSDGVKLSKITTLKNDLAMALAAPSVRIEAPIPGKDLVGIEVPNQERATVRLRELMDAPEYKNLKGKLKLPLGRSVSGRPIVADLAKCPHLLVAGATGSGKSVGMNSFLMSFLYNNSPKDLRMIMIDPKRVELNNYNGIPHLLTPVIVEPDKAATALRWAVAEMTRRYKVCADARHRSIEDYNDDPKIKEKLPRIVIVIDELADMMMVAKQEVEASICRIAQMARAVGMHLLIATQRPSVDVITGLIKANIPARIAFTVASSIDSRTIIDGIGAEDLLGHGDMLYLSGTTGKPVRIQGVFVGSKEIEKVTNKIKIGFDPSYDDGITSEDVANKKLIGIPDSRMAAEAAGADDPMYMEALECIRRSRKASASALQRYLRVGYARASRLIDMLEDNGVIGPANGAKPREIHWNVIED
ncbi:cell division protein FtsK [Candidatus Peregrinibacteria bacterium CG22_combo_CG10-13_8_21_14_all_44_10]|nr:MAG: cell division protein FtsK [Candidatus Peregrinibacteria bacterium CG22_combo_CG10-13_8_21_14_all_44_10]PIS03804.1 MAG: cell division protein FtsK [Candidatus Peregrinibacteria bacterium CG10_big_fil_rev_8_21_14_0_10_44_7]PIX80416.1 MAG: cell division protein FtsK [Candidatus Peregrinibacteria bacterium CG_4_10_14_3_um_filter_44_21]PJB88398.1 MAG: cell division protein FtsK [Candidatus Peregrinibacteria bacterium CG_4_9_14_0_8_um_filter_44_15]